MWRKTRRHVKIAYFRATTGYRKGTRGLFEICDFTVAKEFQDGVGDTTRMTVAIVTRKVVTDLNISYNHLDNSQVSCEVFFSGCNYNHFCLL